MVLDEETTTPAPEPEPQVAPEPEHAHKIIVEQGRDSDGKWYEISRCTLEGCGYEEKGTPVGLSPIAGR